MDLLPVSGENVWYIPVIEGYYQFEGFNGLVTWEEYVKASGHLMKDGCMPFITGWGSKYILMRNGDIYRLQNAVSMGYLWKW